MNAEPRHSPDADQSHRANPAFWITVSALTAANLIPIWGFTYFPSQDGPAHLENAWMLRHWCDPGRDFAAYYALHLEPLPNWFSHAALALLMFAFPPLIAEKVLLTGYLLLFVSAVFYLLGGLGRRHLLFGLLAFPLAYHLLFMKGFWNFAISVPALLFLLGYWWRRRKRPIDGRQVVTVNLLLVLIYFCHLVSAVVGIGCLLMFFSLRGRLRPLAVGRAALLLAPAAALPTWFLLGRGLGDQPLTFDLHPGRLLRLDLLVSHDPRSVWVAIGLAALVAALGLMTLVSRKLRPAPGRRRVDLRDGFLFAAVGLAALSCLVPDDLGGGSLLDLRLALFPPLLVLPWLSANLGFRLRVGVGVAAVVLTAAQLCFVLAPFPRLQMVLADYTSGAAHVPANRTLLPVNLIDQSGIAGSRVSALLHAASYYCVEAGAINLNNYEASTDHFPLRYHANREPLAFIGRTEGGDGHVAPDRYPVPVDFVLIRCPRAIIPGLPGAFRDYAPTRRIVQRYRPVHARGDVWLFTRRGNTWPPPAEPGP